MTSLLIKHEVPHPARLRLKEVWQEMGARSKNFTDEGRKRKARICRKVLYEEKKTLLELHFYVAVMPLLKEYVMLFQTKEPLVHKLHDSQEKIFCEFLTCYVKPDKLINSKGHNLSGPQLKVIDLQDSAICLSTPFVGSKGKAIMQEVGMTDRMIVGFQEKVTKAYRECGSYLQGKLPLSSPTLRALSCLDPDARGSHHILKQLLDMPKMLPTGYLTEKELEEYCLEAHKYASDMGLPIFHDEMRVDQWWNVVRKTGNYPALCKLVFALLSPFHGPQVESAFNVMGDILHVKSANTSVDTYESYQVVKYHLRTVQKDAVKYFAREDPKRSRVDPVLCRNIKLSSSHYRKLLKDKKSRQDEIRRKFLLKKKPEDSKRTGKEKIAEESRKSREAFQQAKQKCLLALKKLAVAKKAKDQKK